MTLNIHFFIALGIAIIACINDIITYCFNLDYTISLIISSILCLSFCSIFIKKRKINISADFCKYDFLILLFFYAYIIAKGIMNIDLEYDTSVYHIYLQKNPFLDKINFDFFPGRIYCAYLFPLGDRMHYIFRYILGYRLGTIFSYYVIIILYYQIKKIVGIFVENKNLISIFSILFMFITSITSYIGTYYIDNLGLIFLLESFYIVFAEKNLLESKFKLYGLALFLRINYRNKNF